MPELSDVCYVGHVEITDTYTLSGKHIKEVCVLLDGSVIWEEGPNPNKDVAFFPIKPLPCPWVKEAANAAAV